MKYDKLIRDKIPRIIEKDGQEPKTRIASEEEYKEKLEEKFQEEFIEFIEDGNPEELADILEVLYALAKSKGLSKEDLEKIREKKAEERGGFDKRIILDEVLKRF